MGGDVFEDRAKFGKGRVRRYPVRFAIMGWFYLDDPNGRDLASVPKSLITTNRHRRLRRSPMRMYGLMS
jgi:hypothetical protein